VINLHFVSYYCLVSNKYDRNNIVLLHTGIWLSLLNCPATVLDGKTFNAMAVDAASNFLIRQKAWSFAENLFTANQLEY